MHEWSLELKVCKIVHSIYISWAKICHICCTSFLILEWKLFFSNWKRTPETENVKNWRIPNFVWGLKCLWISLFSYSVLISTSISILFYSILFYSILFYSILFYSILFYSILFYSILYNLYKDSCPLICWIVFIILIESNDKTSYCTPFGKNYLLLHLSFTFKLVFSISNITFGRLL